MLFRYCLLPTFTDNGYFLLLMCPLSLIHLHLTTKGQTFMSYKFNYIIKADFGTRFLLKAEAPLGGIDLFVSVYRYCSLPRSPRAVCVLERGAHSLF